MTVKTRYEDKLETLRRYRLNEISFVADIQNEPIAFDGYFRGEKASENLAKNDLRVQPGVPEGYRFTVRRSDSKSTVMTDTWFTMEQITEVRVMLDD